MSVQKLVLRKDGPRYTAHANKVLQGVPDLQVLGLWCYLTSMPPEWEFTKEYLKKKFRIGREKLDAILSCLKINKLITMKPMRDEYGRFSHAEIHVHDGENFQEFIEPSDIKASRNDDSSSNTEIPYSGTPGTVCGALVNNNYKDIYRNPIKSRNKQKALELSCEISDRPPDSPPSDFPKPPEKPYEPPRPKMDSMEEDINYVFNHWKDIMDHPHAKLDTKRHRKIKQALKLGYSIDDLCHAISGCSASSYHRGNNPEGKVYDSIDLIFRDADKIEQFINFRNNPPTYKHQTRAFLNPDDEFLQPKSNVIDGAI